MRKVKDINKVVGNNIRIVRTQAGHTQEELAELIGCSANHLSSIERGLGGPSLEIIKKICVLYAISSDVLLFDKLPDNSTDDITERLKHVKPEYLPQVKKVLMSMLEVLVKKERIEQ